MAGPDLILFAVGFVLFAGATYGLVSQEGGLGGLGGTSSLGAFEVTYATGSSEAARSAVANFGGTRDVALAVPASAAYVSKVIVTVECTDPVPTPAPRFTLTVAVAGPNGLRGEGNGECGQSITVEVPVAMVPPATHVAGRTEAEAREKLAEPEGAGLAVGEWKVTVSGSRGTVPSNVPGNPSGAVVLTTETWAATFTPIQGR